MSKGGSGGTQTQTTQTQLPDWVNQGAMSNWQMAQDVSANLKSPYTGNRVAGLTPGQTSNIGALQGNVGSTNPAFANAGAITNGLAGFHPSTVTPQMLSNTSLQPYMNPYTQSVIDPTMALMEQSRRQALGQVGDQATQNKAFGGSRQGIAEGVTNAQSELQKGQFAGQLYGQNFGQAQAAATGDISRDYAAQLANQQAGEWGAQFQGGMANQMGNLATSGQTNFLAGLQAAMGGQGMIQQTEQQKLDAAQALYNEQRQYPLDQLAIRQNALANSPYGQTQVSTKPGPTTDTAGQVLGGVSSAVGIAGSIFAM